MHKYVDMLIIKLKQITKLQGLRKKLLFNLFNYLFKLHLFILIICHNHIHYVLIIII